MLIFLVLCILVVLVALAGWLPRIFAIIALGVGLVAFALVTGMSPGHILLLVIGLFAALGLFVAWGDWWLKRPPTAQDKEQMERDQREWWASKTSEEQAQILRDGERRAEEMFAKKSDKGPA